jgi:hypothetical protein
MFWDTLRPQLFDHILSKEDHDCHCLCTEVLDVTIEVVCYRGKLIASNRG